MFKKLTALVLVLACSLSVMAAKGRGGRIPKGKIKNVIIMISDGCGYYQVDAASLYQYGKTGVQVYERFPFQFGMSTYAVGGSYDSDAAWADFDYVKSGATDSAAAATAMSTGFKTYSGAIGVAPDGQDVFHLLERCEELGMATGVVSSVEFSHATPAGFVAHNVSRNNYAEIANEMIYGSACDVIMGCGAPDFDNSGNPGFGNAKYIGGAGTWADITDDFMVAGADADNDGLGDNWSVIRSREEFQAMAEGDAPARVLGVPYVYQTLQQNRSGDPYAAPYDVPQIETVPTLEEMTKAALNVLDNDEDGLFLMVEGGAVDWAGHANQTGRVIEEEIDFNKSVEAVVAWVQENSDWGETLLVVTGDHETGYMTGPDSDPDWMPLVNNGPTAQPGAEWHSGNHTNQLIPFYAKGSAARGFMCNIEDEDSVRGRYIDNVTLPNVIFKALDSEMKKPFKKCKCGPKLRHCQK